MSTIELTNVGPIQHLTIPIPEDGGIVVLKSTNDRGKSETIEAVAAAVTGRGKVDVRRGCVKGTLSGFGVSVTVGRSMRRSGELEVQSLEGRLSLEDLIQPNVKDPAAADSKRIKTLISVTGAKASPELFHHLVGSREEFDAAVAASSLVGDDLVAMAERIKRDFEAAARKEESLVEHAQGRALGAREAAAGVELDQQSDPIALQAALEAAIASESRIKAESAAAAEAQRSASQARLSLEDIETTYTGPTCVEAERIFNEALTRCQEREQAVVEMERGLALSRQELEAAKAGLKAADAARREAARVEQLVGGWTQAIAKSIPPAPSAEQLAAASAAVTAARQAVEQGALVRRAREHLAEAVAAAKEAVTHTERAHRLRDAARGTDDVLSSLVASSGTPLRVEAGRLMVDTDQGPKTFAELSHGKRSRMALAIAIEAVGEGGVICLKQEFWEGVAPARKLELAEQARAGKVLVLTAQATDDEEIVAETL